jgi:beta-mannosidase
MEAEAWPDLDWERLAHRHCLQKWVFDRRVPPDEFASYADWREATQRYQAEFVKHHVEALRVLKYRPTGGFCHFAFGDAHPAVSWSVLDHLRVAKPSYAALQTACRPVIVVASRLADGYVPGEAIALDVHVVNDLRQPLADAHVDAQVTWEGGEHRWAWQGDVGADDCVRVGTVQMVVPAAPGPLSLRLELTHPRASSANSYSSVIDR